MLLPVNFVPTCVNKTPSRLQLVRKTELGLSYKVRPHDEGVEDVGMPYYTGLTALDQLKAEFSPWLCEVGRV